MVVSSTVLSLQQHSYHFECYNWKCHIDLFSYNFVNKNKGQRLFRKKLRCLS